MICKFCGKDKKLVKAHVIPEAFFRRIRGSPNSLRLITNEVGKHEKKAPVGVYDKQMVCGDCEGLWKTWDEYAQLLLADPPPNSQARYHNGTLLGYVIKDFDYARLKLFFVSLLWRASASTQPFFSKIALGQFEPAAKRLISTADPGDSEDFAVILAKFDSSLAKHVMLEPYRVEFCGASCCCFHIAGFLAHIKVDSKPFPRPWSIVSLSQDRALVMLCKDFRRSKELKLITSVLPPLYNALQEELENWAKKA